MIYPSVSIQTKKHTFHFGDATSFLHKPKQPKITTEGKKSASLSPPLPSIVEQLEESSDDDNFWSVGNVSPEEIHREVIKTQKNIHLSPLMVVLKKNTE